MHWQTGYSSVGRASDCRASQMVPGTIPGGRILHIVWSHVEIFEAARCTTDPLPDRLSFFEGDLCSADVSIWTHILRIALDQWNRCHEAFGHYSTNPQSLHSRSPTWVGFCLFLGHCVMSSRLAATKLPAKTPALAG